MGGSDDSKRRKMKCTVERKGSVLGKTEVYIVQMALGFVPKFSTYTLLGWEFLTASHVFFIHPKLSKLSAALMLKLIEKDSVYFSHVLIIFLDCTIHKYFQLYNLYCECIF